MLACERGRILGAMLARQEFSKRAVIRADDPTGKSTAAAAVRRWVHGKPVH